MKGFSPARVSTTIIGMAAVAVLAAGADTGGMMTTTALASSANVHHSTKTARPATRKAITVAVAQGRVVSESRDATGTYITVVTCVGQGTPPPVTITASAPFTIKGTMDTKGVTRALAQRPSGYAPVYACHVTVLKKLPSVCRPGQTLVSGMTSRPACMTAQEELAWFVSEAVSSSGPKSKACLTARELAGKGNQVARKAERFSCSHKVVVNTGFGGAAGPVSRHHPHK